MGVTLVNGSDSFFEEDTTQVYIYDVSKGSAADKAGLKRGDQILKIDDTSIKDISDVTTIISNHSAGDTIKMTVLRDTQTKTITVTLGEASNTNNADTAQNAPQNNNRQ